MREIIHERIEGQEPTSESIIETHLGVKPIDTSQLGPIKHEPMRGSTREELEYLLRLSFSWPDRENMDDQGIIDTMLDKLIERSRGYSGYATLFLKGVKDGRY